MYKFDNRFYADVRIEDRFSTGIMYRNGILESSKTRNEKRAFIRVFDGNIWYYASTSEVKNVQTELNNLYKQAPSAMTGPIYLPPALLKQRA